MILHDNRQEDIIITQALKEAIDRAIEAGLKYFAIENLSLEISLSYVEEKEIKALNASYRKIDEITDVLSFPLVDDVENLSAEDLLGDIVLCPLKAQMQAEEYGHSFLREMVYLSIHSLLHLLGYDHMSEEEKKEMRRIEDDIMNNLNLSSH